MIIKIKTEHCLYEIVQTDGSWESFKIVTPKHRVFIGRRNTLGDALELVLLKVEGKIIIIKN